MSLNLSTIALGVNSYLMNSVNHDVSHRNRVFNEMKLKKEKGREWKSSGQNMAADLPSSYQPLPSGFGLGSAVKYQGLQSVAWHLFLESKVISY